MFQFPKSTEYGRRIAKQKFYDNLTINASLKKIFSEEISSIIWRNKFSPETINLAKGSNVSEIEVLLIKCNQPSIDTRVLQLIDREISFHILFLLEYNDRFQAWIGYKEASLSKADTFKVNRYYNTEWFKAEELSLSINGLSLDAVYDNFVRQIAGDKLAVESGTDLKQAIEEFAEIEKLRKQIAVLETKLRNEKQFNKQVEINNQIKKLKMNWKGDK